MTKHATRYHRRLAFSVLVSKMEVFAAELTAEDFAYLPIDPNKKTQFTRRHAPRKYKGGKPPMSYQGIEDWIDLRLHLQREEFIEAIPIYYRLKRLLNW